MARLNETLVTAREQFVKDFFKSNPLQGVREANEALTAAHPGGKMGLKRCYELEAEVKGANDENVAALVTSKTAGQPLVINNEVEFKALTDAKAAADAEIASLKAKLVEQDATFQAEVADLKAKLAAKPEKPAKGPTLKERIVESLATPQTIQTLGAALGVTGSTLRSRVSELVKAGTLLKAEDGTLSLAPPTVEATIEAEVTAQPAPAQAASEATVAPVEAPVAPEPAPVETPVATS
jgi:hypothetical protein